VRKRAAAPARVARISRFVVERRFLVNSARDVNSPVSLFGLSISLQRAVARAARGAVSRGNGIREVAITVQERNNLCGFASKLLDELPCDSLAVGRRVK